MSYAEALHIVRHVGLFTPERVALAYATVDYYEWCEL